VGGWFDAENLYGALQLFKTLEKQSPGTEHTLVMGPWCHGCWYRSGTGEQLGDIRFNDKTGPWYQRNVEAPFVRKHLKGETDWKHSKTIVFETGANQWRRFDTWPPTAAQQRTFFARAGGRLSADAPTEATAFEEYVSDPAKPVPYIDKTGPGMMVEYMTADQRFATRRPDVVTFMTPPLEEDLTITGDVTHSLWVSTTGTDSDFIVKLVDVYPDNYPDPAPNPTGVRMGGYQQLIRGDVIRGKFRNGFDKPTAFKPGEPTRVEFTVNDVFHTFRTGHRVMMQIQSTWFPLVDRNPQQFLNINLAKESDFRKATQRVFTSGSMPTQMRVRVLPREIR
jgi:putative CocE/NonD family hydrolase